MLLNNKLEMILKEAAVAYFNIFQNVLQYIKKHEGDLLQEPVAG
jgi:hypothetical protein